MNAKNQELKPEQCTGNEKRSRLFSSIPLSAILLPLAPVILIYSGNINRIDVDVFLFTAFIFFLCYLILTLFLRMLFNNREVTDSVLAALFTGVFVNIYTLDQDQQLWFVAWVFVTLIIIIFKKPRPYLPVLFDAIAIAAVALGAYACLSQPTIWSRPQLSSAVEQRFPAIPTDAGNNMVKRDIYYIVLDRYARADQLQQIYGFDNSEFLQALEKFGFKIANDAYSNYQRTAHSLSSSLNMDLLDQIADRNEEKIDDWVPIYRRIRKSRLVDFLKQKGFEFLFLGTWWEPTRSNPDANVEVNYRAWPALTRAVLENSILGQIARSLEIAQFDPRALQCLRAKKKFSALARLAKERTDDQPRFIFAHFLVPHPPFVIDEDGNCLSTETVAARTREQNYVQQVKYANRQVLNFLQQIQQSKGPKPVIILQADEGPWPKRYARDEIYRLAKDVSDVNWQKASPAELREKMAILNALYLPDLRNFEISANATPVNNFRLVLRKYFDSKLPALPNRSYAYPNNSDIYHFEDVTDKLRLQQ